MTLPMVVVSTSKSPPADARTKHTASVALASACAWDGLRCSVVHDYYDAAEQNPPRTHWENLIYAIGRLPPETIVVSLDGDDWLGPHDALIHVARAHEAGAWVTWGSFVFADGRPGFARTITPAEHARIREIPWVTTHLKSYRAGLFQRIDWAHFKTPDGAWLEHARDLAVMFPCLEMAGFDRSRFITETLCVYNFSNSTQFVGGAKMLADERAQVEYVRGLPPYARIEVL